MKDLLLSFIFGLAQILLKLAIKKYPVSTTISQLITNVIGVKNGINDEQVIENIKMMGLSSHNVLNSDIINEIEIIVERQRLKDDGIVLPIDEIEKIVKDRR